MTNVSITEENVDRLCRLELDESVAGHGGPSAEQYRCRSCHAKVDKPPTTHECSGSAR